MRQIKGSYLNNEARKQAIAIFINRFTGDHKPLWVREHEDKGVLYPIHFKDDDEWLANTLFVVTKKGNLDRRNSFCESSPTFPQGREIIKR